MTIKDAELAQKAHNFLVEHPMGVLSTASAEGLPWGSAVYFYVDEDFNFYFVTRTETHKNHNISSNPQAALTVADRASQTTVQLAGAVSKVSAEDYSSVVFEKLESARPKDGNTWVPPLEKIHAGNYIALKLTPTTIRYADYSQQKTDPRASYIHDVI